MAIRKIYNNSYYYITNNNKNKVRNRGRVACYKNVVKKQPSFIISAFFRYVDTTGCIRIIIIK